jgi:hypothetical protein
MISSPRKIPLQGIINNEIISTAKKLTFLYTSKMEGNTHESHIKIMDMILMVSKLTLRF